MDITSWESYLQAHPDPIVDAFRLQLEQHLSFPFTYQEKIGNAVADFYFEKQQLIVFIEGEAHDHSDGYYRHLEQLKHWRSQGFNVLAFPRFELEKSQEETLAFIQKELDKA